MLIDHSTFKKAVETVENLESIEICDGICDNLEQYAKELLKAGIPHLLLEICSVCIIMDSLVKRDPSRNLDKLLTAGFLLGYLTKQKISEVDELEKLV